jgi:hypothetical protein
VTHLQVRAVVDYRPGDNLTVEAIPVFVGYQYLHLADVSRLVRTTTLVGRYTCRPPWRIGQVPELAELESTKRTAELELRVLQSRRESVEGLEKEALLESLAGKALKPWTNWPRRSAT